MESDSRSSSVGDPDYLKARPWRRSRFSAMLSTMKNYEYYYLAKLNSLADASLRTRIKGSLKVGQRIHVSAVCGKAMASVACMLRDYGYDVSGSDASFNPPMSDVLKSQNIKCREYSKNNLKNIDLLVVGNTLSHSAIEVEDARKKKIPMVSGAEVVGQLFKSKRSLVVAGTHGKTTTSAMLTHVFSVLNPAFLIGGVFQKSTQSYSVGSKKSKYVIYEGDEYNSAFFDRGPKFLHYNPSSVILTSVEYDHIDLYNSFEDYRQTFQFLVESIPRNGYLLVHREVKDILDLSLCSGKVFTYGNADADYLYRTKKVTEKGTIFEIKTKKGVVELQTPLFGDYNLANTTAVYALSTLEGLKQSEIIERIKDFPGTKERQELLGETKDGVKIIRDYAHHPKAVELTIKGLRERYPKKKIFCVFEPRSASSKRKDFEESYSKSLSSADSVIIVDPGVRSDNAINVENIVKNINFSKEKSYSVKNCVDALSLIKKKVTSNQVVVFMSSGDMEGIPKKFLG